MLYVSFCYRTPQTPPPAVTGLTNVDRGGTTTTLYTQRTRAGSNWRMRTHWVCLKAPQIPFLSLRGVLLSGKLMSCCLPSWQLRRTEEEVFQEPFWLFGKIWPCLLPYTQKYQDRWQNSRVGVVSAEERGMREGKQRRKTSLKVYVNWTQFQE